MSSNSTTSVRLWRRIFDERRRIVLPLIILVVTNIAVWLLAVLPLTTNVQTAEAEARDATVALASARRLDRQTKEAGVSKQRADEELHNFYTEVLPRTSSEATKTTNVWLQQAALDAGLKFKGSHFDVADIRDSTLSRAFSKVTLQGRYPDIRRFLYAVETAKEFIVVERVELAQVGTDQQAASGLLEISLTVATYFVAPPAR